MVKFECSDEDTELVKKIVSRAMALDDEDGKKCFKSFLKMDIQMDILATHCNGTKLRLADFLAADDFNFMHDIFGIRNCIDRKTGKMMNGFLPRFAIFARPEGIV